MTSQVTAPAWAAAARRLLATEAGWDATAARLALAVVMFPHGAQKAFGWFGGYGWSGTMGFLTGTIGLPAALAAGVILIELLAPVLLLLGLATRAAALGIAAVMVGAVATVHLSSGFFMNWSGTQAGEGFEYHLLALGLAAVLALGGGGRASLDRQVAG
ncbi:MAG TPA: DoxX family protein [Planctomycetota bacterium]